LKALVLAAGIGSRLRPESEIMPKPLWPVLGIAQIEWVLKRLRKAGVCEVIVNLCHLGEKIENHLKSKDFGISISFSKEKEILGTLGALLAPQVKRFFEGENAFLVHNADIFLDFDLIRLFDFHESKGGIATMLFCKGEKEDVCEVSGGKLISIRGVPEYKGGERFVFSGVSVQTGEVYRRFEEGIKGCLVKDYILPMLKEGKEVFALVAQDGLFFDIGTKENYLALNKMLLPRAKEVFLSAGFEPPMAIDDGVFVFGNPRIEKGARIFAPTLICDRAIIENGASVGPYCVVCDEAVVPEGTVVQESVVFPKAVAWSGAQAIMLSST
jgi:NDP-sugar pyrophosphorylase family protein